MLNFPYKVANHNNDNELMCSKQATDWEYGIRTK